MIGEVQWICEGVDMPDIDIDRTAKWLNAVAQSHGRKVSNLSYIFCDDAKILEINRQFLGHDYYTDIITFENSHGKLISGDMFISLETVASNAKLLGNPYEAELKRVIVHGVLHLCGIDDKGEGARQIMERNEDKALELLEGD